MWYRKIDSLETSLGFVRSDKDHCVDDYILIIILYMDNMFSGTTR